MHLKDSENDINTHTNSAMTKLILGSKLRKIQQTIQKIELKSWFFGEIYKIDKCIAKSMKRKRTGIQINEIIDKKENIITNT